MWVAAFGGNPLGRPRGRRGCRPTAPGTNAAAPAWYGTSRCTQTARLLGTNRGFDTRLPGGGSYEGQCRCAFLFYRQENISARTPRLLGRTVLCRLCNESGRSEAWDPHAHEQACSVMCIVGT